MLVLAARLSRRSHHLPFFLRPSVFAAGGEAEAGAVLVIAGAGK